MFIRSDEAIVADKIVGINQQPKPRLAPRYPRSMPPNAGIFRIVNTFLYHLNSTMTHGSSFIIRKPKTTEYAVASFGSVKTGIQQQG